nr:MAG TPA: hypothetical protein [Caudoviricetes sp.]
MYVAESLASICVFSVLKHDIISTVLVNLSQAALAEPVIEISAISKMIFFMITHH